MAIGFDKQPASRPNVYQNLFYVGGASPSTGVVSNKFGVATQHVRIISSLYGWGSIDQSTAAGSGTVGSSSVPGAGMQIPVSTVGGEYFVVTPGQVFNFASTSTASGTISITEMA